MSPQNRNQKKPESSNDRGLRPQLSFFEKKNKEDIQAANKPLKDIALQNKVQWLEFIALCNKNYIFFLWITQQYFLLLLLFKYPPLMKQRMKCKKKMQAYKAALRKNHLKNSIKTPKIDVLPRSAHQSTHQAHFDWTQSEPYLSSIIELQQDMKSILKKGRRNHPKALDPDLNDLLDRQASSNLYRN